MKAKKELSERDKLIQGFENRIKHKTKQLAKTRKFHREVEATLMRKIRLDEMQLRGLKKG